ncbi:MAG: tyrosine--tRNA ligase, partial [Cyanobacteria bacterium J06633_2]
GNYVGLREDALSMYSKLEKTPDSILNDYVELLTKLNLEDLPDNPRDRQKLLALTVVSQFHGEQAANEAQQAALTLVQGDASQAEAVPEFSLAETEFPVKLFYLLGASGLCKSSGEGRRQIQGGAVRLDGDRIEDVNITFESADDLDGKVLQVGKKKFIRLVR